MWNPAPAAPDAEVAGDSRQVRTRRWRDPSRYAALYDDGSHDGYFFQRRRALVLAALDGEPRGRILDVGCGPGLMAQPVVAQGHSFQGIDSARDMIAAARAANANAARTEFSIGRAERLMLPAASFSAVLCMGVLEYLSPGDVGPAIANMVRVLGDEGLLVMSCLNQHSPFWIARSLWTQFARLLHHRLQAPPVRTFDRAEILDQIAAAGLAVESVRYFSFNVMPHALFNQFPRRAWRLSRVLERLAETPLRWLGLAFLVTARKTTPTRRPAVP